MFPYGLLKLKHLYILVPDGDPNIFHEESTTAFWGHSVPRCNIQDINVGGTTVCSCCKNKQWIPTSVPTHMRR